MPRTLTALEIEHYSELISSLVVTASRADDPALLTAIRAELVEAFSDMLALLSAPDLVADLAGPLLERALAAGAVL